MQAFRKLKVWEKSHALTLALYRETRSFPRAETYRLVDQICRAASSIPANIAEGCGRASDGEMRQFLQQALGSASELEYHLLLAHDLAFIPDDRYTEYEGAIVEIQKMLTAMVLRLRQRTANGRRAAAH
jgi:four helix bundle protein